MKIILHNWNDLIGLLCIDFTNYWPALMNHSGTRCSWGSSIPKRYKTCSIIETFSILPLSPTFRCWFGPLAVAVFLFGNFFQVVRRSCFCWLATLGDIKINRNDQQFLADASKQEPEQWQEKRNSGTDGTEQSVFAADFLSRFPTIEFLFRLLLQPHIVSPLFFLPYRDWSMFNQSWHGLANKFSNVLFCVWQ